MGVHAMDRPLLLLLPICLIVLPISAATAQTAAQFNEMGIDAYDRNEFKQAIAYFEQAYEGSPSNANVRRNLCNAHQSCANDLAKNNDFSDAVRHLELAIGVDPENVSPLVQLGSYYLRLKMIPEAIFRLEESIELKPGYVDAHELLGQAYYEDNDLASARAQWDYVLEVDPDREHLRALYEKAFREESVEYDFKKTQSRHFRISAPAGLSRSLQTRVLTILERIYLDIGRKFGGVFPPPPIQVILYSSEEFTEATQLEAHVGAVYDGKIRVPVTDQTGQVLSDAEIQRRITHEYVHVVVRYQAGSNVPWWLNEGLAETLSKDFDERELGILRQTYQDELAFPLASLEGSQLERLSPDSLRLAYLQSHATANLLWTRYGYQRLRPLMADLATGLAMEQALQRHYRRSYAVLEAEVAASIE